MPAVAVRRMAQVLFNFTRRKGFVGCFKLIFFNKVKAKKPIFKIGTVLKPINSSEAEEIRISNLAMKCFNIRWNFNCESKSLGFN